MKKIYTNTIFVFFISVFIALMNMPAAYACTNPVGGEGEMIYNTTHKTMQFCDGSDWWSMRAPDAAPSLITCGELEDLGSMLPVGYGDFYNFQYHAPSGKWIASNIDTVTDQLNLVALTPPNGTTITTATVSDSVTASIPSNPAITVSLLSVLNDLVFLSESDINQNVTITKMYSFDGTTFTFLSDTPGNVFPTFTDGTYYYSFNQGAGASDPSTITAYELLGNSLSAVSTANLINPSTSANTSASGIYDSETGHIIVTVENRLAAYSFDGTSFSLEASTASDIITSTNSIKSSRIKKYGDIFTAFVGEGEASETAKSLGVRFIDYDGSSFSYLSPVSGILMGYNGSFSPSSNYIWMIKDSITFTPDFSVMDVAYFDRTSGQVNIIESSTVLAATSGFSYASQEIDSVVSSNYRYYKISEGTCGSGSSCTMPALAGGGTIPDGKSALFFQINSNNEILNWQTRSCTNGTLSGSYDYLGADIVYVALPTKVICTHYHSKGMLSDELMDIEYRYAAMIDPMVQVGYLHWATPAVEWLQRNEWVDPVVAPMVRAWATQVAYRMGEHETGSWLGRVLLFVGEPLSKWIGHLVTPDEEVEKLREAHATANNS